MEKVQNVGTKNAFTSTLYHHLLFSKC